MAMKPSVAVRDYTVPEDRVPLVIPEQLGVSEIKLLKEEIADLLRQRKAVLVAHYYVDGSIQDLAEETGGCVSDSLEMARFGRENQASTLVVSGVRFMGETAKILSPDKMVVMPTLEAECSLDLGCPPEDFEKFCQANPDRKVVVYANTSVHVKALADWVVTSSVALPIIDALDASGQKILWAPDKHLGRYIQQQTGADMLLWSGSCVVHDEFKSKALFELKRVYPEAGVLVHPESPAGVIDVADAVGSTSQILKAARELPHKEFVVATDRGLFHKLRQQNPNKRFLEAPTAGEGATCRSCAHCPWMAMNDLRTLAAVLRDKSSMHDNEIVIDPILSAQAMIPLKRMLDFPS